MGDGNCNIDYVALEKMIPLQVEKVRIILQDKHQVDIPAHCQDFLFRCLRLKDGNIEKTIKLIMSFYGAIADFPNWNADLLPSIHQDLYDAGIVTPLPTRDSLGRRIFVIRAEFWDPQKWSFDQTFLCIWMMGQTLIVENEDVQREGYVTIWDFANFTTRQALAVNHRRFYLFGKFAHNGVMGRVKGFHIVNYAMIVKLLYAALKPFLKEKLRKRVIFHDKFESLCEHFDAKSLPTFLDGKLGDEDCFDKDLINSLLKYDNFFSEMLQDGVPSK